MTARFRSWRQKIKQHPLITVGIVIALLAVIAFMLSVSVFGWDWTGFIGGESKITKTPQGTATEYSPGKNLWDWMQLLLIPLLLAIGGFWLNQIQKSREEKATEQRDKTEREIAKDNQQEAVLQAYIDKISELLLKEHLDEQAADGTLKPEYEQVRNVARVRTITILTQLNARRVSYVFAFLREAGLMSPRSNDNAVSLSNADLSAVNWSQANLSGAYLRGANLSEANLSGAYLRGANLSGARLIEANISDADLNNANLSSAYLIKANLSGAYLSFANLSEALQLHFQTEQE